MFQPLVACPIVATCFVLVAAGSAAAEEQLRTWTNRLGDRRAQARLVSVSGSEIRLENAAGHRKRTTLDALSDSDRAYVVEFLKTRQPEASASTGRSLPLMRHLIDTLANIPAAIGQAPGAESSADNTPGGSGAGFNLLAPLLQTEVEQRPATLVHVRVSHSYLANFVARDVNRLSAVRDQILGTFISGSAQTNGTTRLILHPSESDALAEVIFHGTVQSQTIGHNGPVRLHSTAQTPFESRKLVTINQSGVQSYPTKTAAQTRSTTHHIESLLPGLRGRISQRIAWRRAGELRGQADAIASSNIRRQLNTEFDQTVDRALSEARGALKLRFGQLATGDVKLPEHLHYRSTPEFVEMTLRNPRADQAATVATVQGPSFEGTPDVAVRVHRVALRSALNRADINKALRPLMSGLLIGEPSGLASLEPVAAPAAPDLDWSWSADGQWIQVDFSRGRLQNSRLAASSVVER